MAGPCFTLLYYTLLSSFFFFTVTVKDPRVPYATTATLHPIIARGPPAKEPARRSHQSSSIALSSISSAFQSANPARGTVGSNYEPLTSVYNLVSSSPYSVSSTLFSISSSPPSLTSNPKPFSPTSRPLSPALSLPMIP